MIFFESLSDFYNLVLTSLPYLYEGSLQFLAKQLSTNGNIIHQRMAFTYQKDSDSVLQVIESSTDEGKTWNLSFNGLYKRKKNRFFFSN